LLAEILSSMKSQISALTPAIAGIVVGITSMIVAILGALSKQLEKAQTTGTAADIGAGRGLLDLFGDGVPTYHFQIIVGLYVIQITYILSIIQNGIENGTDKLNQDFELGNNLINSTTRYFAVSLIIMLIFNFVASAILTRSGI